MKWLLRFFPRPLLIRLSLRFRPLLKWWFKGSAFTDPIDGSSYRKFLPYGYGETLRPHALCPGTLSLERHRLLWLYLKNHTPFLSQSLSVLHVAPEQVFYKTFKAIKSWRYITTDLHSPLAEVKADLCHLPFKDNQFDLIFCNHVLEHIVEDQKAIKELYRVLEKGGTLIAQVPLDASRTQTYEDPSITESQARAKAFGQYDHVRIYGLDFYERLQKVGFSTQAVFIQEKLNAQEITRYALPPHEKIPVATK